MSFHSFTRIQHLPITLEKAWDFFSSPVNLKEITPSYMGFEIKNGPIGKMYAGQIICYTVKPLLSIPLFWMTEITHVKDLSYFIDEQRIGPYILWHHQHHFKATEKGVEMSDIVHYKLPMGILGEIANGLFIRKQLESIFDFRYQQLEKIFPQ